MEDRRVLAVPGAPLDVTPVSGDHEVALTWTAPAASDPAITDYLISYRVASNVNAAWTDYADDVTPDPTAIVTGLTNGVAYVFRVMAVNDDALAGGPPSAVSSSSTPAGLPDAPQIGSALAGVGQVTLSWSAAAGNGRPVTSYIVEITNADTNAVQTRSVAATVSPTMSTVISGLSNGTTYAFRVAAVNGVSLNGQTAGEYSYASDPVTPSVPPSPPSVSSVELAAGVGEVGQLLVTWTDLAGSDPTIASYVLQYRSGGGQWQTFGDQLFENSQLVTGLVDGAGYSFRVAARSIYGALGDYSSASQPVAPSPLPEAPYGVMVVVDGGTATLSWLAASGYTVGIGSYRVECTKDGGATWLPYAASVPGGITHLVLQNLERGQSYQFRVAAVTTRFNAREIGARQIGNPDAPANLAVTGGDRSVRLTWSDPVNAGGLPVTGFAVSYQKMTVIAGAAVPGPSVPVAGWPTSTGSGYELVVPGLANGSVYRFSVVTQTGDGLTSLVSQPAKGDAVPVPLVGRVSATGVVGTVATPGRVAVSWAAPAMPRGVTIVDYVVQYSSNGGATWQTYADGVSRIASTRLNLDNGKAYQVRVAAVTVVAGIPGSSQQSDFSRPSGYAMPYARGAVLPAVTGVVASSARGAVALAWVPPAGNAGGPPIRYVVQYRQATSTGAWSQPQAPVSGAAVTIPRLTVGRSYVFRVAAVNAGGVGPFNTPITVTVL